MRDANSSAVEEVSANFKIGEKSFSPVALFLKIR
jgi:hypothetical protein